MQHQVGDALSDAPSWPWHTLVPEHDGVHPLFRGHLADAVGGISGFAPAPNPDVREALCHPRQVPLRIGGLARIGGFGPRPSERTYRISSSASCLSASSAAALTAMSADAVVSVPTRIFRFTGTTSTPRIERTAG